MTDLNIGYREYWNVWRYRISVTDTNTLIVNFTARQSAVLVDNKRTCASQLKRLHMLPDPHHAVGETEREREPSVHQSVTPRSQCVCTTAPLKLRPYGAIKIWLLLLLLSLCRARATRRVASNKIWPRPRSVCACAAQRSHIDPATARQLLLLLISCWFIHGCMPVAWRDGGHRLPWAWCPLCYSRIGQSGERYTAGTCRQQMSRTLPAQPYRADSSDEELIHAP